MLDVRRMWILRQVAMRGSFAAAAQALAYTPSAISQQIAALEREVGTRLVERGARGVSLTEPGRILVTHAETVFAQLESIEKELHGFSRLESGLLRLGWFATAGSTLVPRSVAVFRARYPGVQLDLFQGDPSECVTGLRAGELTVALVYQFGVEPDLPDDIEQIDLMDDRVHVGLPRGHRLAGQKRVDLVDLAEDYWIQGVRHGATLEILPIACRAAGFEPIVALRSDDRTVVEGLVAAGAGITLVPQITVPNVRPDVVVRPLTSDLLPRKVRVALLAGGYRSPATLAMIEVVREMAAELVAELRAREAGWGAEQTAKLRTG